MLHIILQIVYATENGFPITITSNAIRVRQLAARGTPLTLNSPHFLIVFGGG